MVRFSSQRIDDWHAPDTTAVRAESPHDHSCMAKKNVKGGTVVDFLAASFRGSQDAFSRRVQAITL